MLPKYYFYSVIIALKFLQLLQISEMSIYWHITRRFVDGFCSRWAQMILCTNTFNLVTHMSLYSQYFEKFCFPRRLLCLLRAILTDLVDFGLINYFNLIIIVCGLF